MHLSVCRYECSLAFGMRAGIRASVCLFACAYVRACIRLRVYGYECYMPAYMFVYLNVPDFSYILLLTSKCDVVFFVMHAVAHA